jgi:hypothetical protein
MGPKNDQKSSGKAASTSALDDLAKKFTAGLSILGSSVAPPPALHLHEDIAKHYNISEGSSAGLVYCLTKALYNTGGFGSSKVAAASVQLTTKTAGAAAVEEATTSAGASKLISGLNDELFMDLDEDDQLFLVIASNDDIKCFKWLVQLVACEQVRSLSDMNVRNYFASAKIKVTSTKPIIKVLTYAASVMPSIMSSVSMRDAIYDNEFVTYHTSAASSPQLVYRAMEALGSSAEMIYAAEDIVAVKAAIETPWDLQSVKCLSTRCLAISDAVLKIFGSRPEIWYQGSRARASTPAAMMALWEEMFRQYKELMLSSDVIGRTTTIKQLFMECNSKIITAPKRAVVMQEEAVSKLEDVARVAVYKKAEDSIKESVPEEKVTALTDAALTNVGMAKKSTVPVATTSADQ